MKRLQILAAVAITAAYANAGFIVTPTDDATALANAILGSGITIVGTPTLSDVSGQSGTFANFDSGPYTQTGGVTGQYTMPSGIILSSGNAVDAQNPYPNNSSSYGANTDEGGGGSAALSALIGGQATYDADVLTIQFTSTSNQLYFNFAFASTEYPQYIGSYNDVFGFFVNGTNVAVIPATTTPISVNDVNAATNSQYFTQYSSLAAGTPFDYGGITTLLTATATVNGNGTTVNTIQLAVADALDHVLDSAVLIQGGTLGTVNPVVPEPSTFSLVFGGGLVALLAVKRRRREGEPVTAAADPGIADIAV